VLASAQVSPQAREAWTSLRELDPSLPPDPLSPTLLKKGLGAGAQVTNQGETTRAEFTLAAPAKLFPGTAVGGQSWELVLDRESVRRLAALTGWGGSPAVAALLPAPTDRVSEAEYRDLLVYLLGSGLAADAAGLLIDRSTVSLTVDAGRPIRSAEGAVSVSGTAATYRWPLVKVLALTSPLRLSMTF